MSSPENVKAVKKEAATATNGEEDVKMKKSSNVVTPRPKQNSNQKVRKEEKEEIDEEHDDDDDDDDDDAVKPNPKKKSVVPASTGKSAGDEDAAAAPILKRFSNTKLDKKKEEEDKKKKSSNVTPRPKQNGNNKGKKEQREEIDEEHDDDDVKPNPEKMSVAAATKSNLKVKKQAPVDDDSNTRLSKRNSNTKLDKKTKTKKVVKLEVNGKKRERKVYDLRSQKQDPPEQTDPQRIFYETLYEQLPRSEMAQFCVTGAYQFTPTTTNSRFHNNFSQVDETEENEASPIPHQNDYQIYEVNSLIHVQEDSGRRRLSGDKRKLSFYEMINATVESLMKEFVSVPMSTEFTIKHVKVDESAESTKKAIDILYEMPNLPPNLFDAGLELIENKHKKHIFLHLRDDADRLRWLIKNA